VDELKVLWKVHVATTLIFPSQCELLIVHSFIKHLLRASLAKALWAALQTLG
jgi:hypothetical protein